jgi:hypothetical protein
MTHTTRELLGMVAKLNQAVPEVVLGVLDNSLTPAKQSEFGELLVDAGHLVQDHAQERTKVIDSEACAGGLPGRTARNGGHWCGGGTTAARFAGRRSDDSGRDCPR